MSVTHRFRKVFLGELKSEFLRRSFQDGVTFGYSLNIFYSVKTAGKYHVLYMTGIDGNLDRLIRVIRVVPVFVLFELVAKYPVDEVLDTEERPLCPFCHDVFHGFDSHLFDACQGPVNFIRGIIGEKLHCRVVDVRRYNLGARAAFHL